MRTVYDLAQELGISSAAVKRRLYVLRTMGVNGYTRGGPNGALLVTDQTAGLLHRALDLEQQGLPMRAALERALESADVATKSRTEGESAGRAPRAQRSDDQFLSVLRVIAILLALGVTALWVLVALLVIRVGQ